MYQEGTATSLGHQRKMSKNYQKGRVKDMPREAAGAKDENDTEIVY
jgi:hypothetical protein